MNSNRRFDAILFDLGSTLVYFDGDWAEVYARSDATLLRALRDAGLKLEPAAFLAEFHRRMEAYFVERETEFIEHTTHRILKTLLAEWGFGDLPDAILRPALAARYAVSRAHWLPETDAIPTLQTLRQQGYRLGLLSNAGDDADVQAIVDNGGFRPYLDFVLSSAALGYRKPNPRSFRAALDHWNTIPSRAAMVGDTLGADILGAQNLGLFAIWITRRANSAANRAHEDTIQPDAAIATLQELPSLLDSLPLT